MAEVMMNERGGRCMNAHVLVGMETEVLWGAGVHSRLFWCQGNRPAQPADGLWCACELLRVHVNFCVCMYACHGPTLMPT